MAGKIKPASTGYFNKEMREILKKGETKQNQKSTKTSGKSDKKKGK